VRLVTKMCSTLASRILCSMHSRWVPSPTLKKSLDMGHGAVKRMALVTDRKAGPSLQRLCGTVQ
jgi:hypothetical protein